MKNIFRASVRRSWSPRWGASFLYLIKLNKEKNISIITGNEKEYKGGIVIIPSYLAKGLEFDVAFIADASDTKYKIEEFDAKLLYVSMTRPLHKLYIYYIDEVSKLLEDIHL